MSKLITGSIDLTTLCDMAKKGHSAFSRSQKNGKVYVNLVMWLNDEPDQYGNDMSIQLGSSKEKRDAEGKTYVGNAKIQERQGGEPVQANAQGVVPGATIDNLPF